MKLMLELTDDQIDALRDILRVGVEDARSAVVSSVQENHSKLAYAVKIVRARSLLGMSVNFRDICDDYVKKDDFDFCVVGIDQ